MGVASPSPSWSLLLESWVFFWCFLPFSWAFMYMINEVNFWGLVGYPNHYMAFLWKAVFQVQNNQFTNHLWNLGSAFDLVWKEWAGHVKTESLHSVLPAVSVADEVLCFPRLSVFLSLTVHREKLWIRDHSLLPKPLSERRILWPHRKYFHLQLQSWAHWSHVSEIVQVFYAVSCC